MKKKVFTVITAFVFVLAILLSGQASAQSQEQQSLEVSVERANVRDLPSLKGEVIFQVFRNDILRVIQKEGGWYFVETFSGRRGYISNTVVRIVELRPKPIVPSSPASSSIFGNSDVIAMVKAGLSDDIIIAAIKQSDSAEFDLSPAGLIALKEGGVSEAIIQALIERIAATTPDSGTSTIPAAIPFQIAPTIEPAARDETPNTPGRFGVGLNIAADIRPRVWYDISNRITVSGMAGWERLSSGSVVKESAFWFIPELLYRFPQPENDIILWEPFLGGGFLFGQYHKEVDIGVFGGRSENSISFQALLGSGGILFTFKSIPHLRFSGELTVIDAGIGTGDERIEFSTTGFRFGGHYRF